MKNDFNTVSLNEDERFVASLCHLSVLFCVIVGPFCALFPAYFWYREHQKGTRGSDFVTFHSAQSTLFQVISVSLFFLSAVVTLFFCFLFIGLFFIPLVVILGVAIYVYGIYSGVKVWQGENPKYLIIGDEIARRIP